MIPRFPAILFSLLDIEHPRTLTATPPEDRLLNYLWVRVYLETTRSPIPHRRVMGDFADLPIADLEHVYRELLRWITSPPSPPT